MKEMVVDALLNSAVYPLLIGLIVGWLGQRRGEAQAQFAFATAVVLGFSVCFRGTTGFNFPPHSALDWIPYLALAALFVQLAVTRLPAVFKVLLPLFLIFGVLWFLLGPIARNNQWALPKTLMVLGAISLAWLALYLAHVGDRKPGDAPARLLLMLLTATGFSIVAILSESAKLAQLTGGLAAATGGLFLVWCLARKLEPGQLVPAVFAGTLGGLMVYGYFYVEIPLYAIGLVVLSWGSNWLLRVPFIANLGAWPRTILVLLTALLPLGVAAYCIEAFKPEGEYYEY